MENTLILFDCFGVICDEITTTWYTEHFGKEMAEQLAQEYNTRADLGQLTMEDVAKLLAVRFNMDANTILADWHSRIYVRPETIALLQTLQKNYHLALVSNVMPNFLEKIFAENDVDKYFEKEIFSYKIKLAKPDLKIFQYAIDSYLPHQFDKIIMIDDNICNLKHLHEIGIDSVLFTNVDDAKKQLNKMGIIC